VGCNIVLMKRFLPLFILTGLLFGQDVLHLKTGESLFWSYRTADLANHMRADLGDSLTPTKPTGQRKSGQVKMKQ